MGADVAGAIGIKENVLRPVSSKDLRAAGQQPLTCNGVFNSRLKLGNKHVDTEVCVVKEINGALLSLFDSISLEILPKKFPAQICHVSYAKTIFHSSNGEGGQLDAIKDESSDSPAPVALPRWPHTRNPTATECAEHFASILAAFPRVFGTRKNSVKCMEALCTQNFLLMHSLSQWQHHVPPHTAGEQK